MKIYGGTVWGEIYIYIILNIELLVHRCFARDTERERLLIAERPSYGISSIRKTFVTLLLYNWNIWQAGITPALRIGDYTAYEDVTGTLAHTADKGREPCAFCDKALADHCGTDCEYCGLHGHRVCVRRHELMCPDRRRPRAVRCSEVEVMWSTEDPISILNSDEQRIL